MNKLTISAMLLALTPALGGCVMDVEKEFATAAVTSALETPKKQTSGREIAEALHEDCSLSAEEAAAEAAARPSVGVYPEGCAAKQADGADLHVQFDGCTGVFGKVELNGGLDASLAATGACRLSADVNDSGDLTANGRELSYQASADIEVLPGARDVDWSAHWSGTTRRGRTIEQDSQLHVLVDQPTSCLDIDGSANGHVDEYDYDIEVEALSICPQACPDKGTVRAAWEGRFRDREISIEFDGSSFAHVTGWTGRQFEVEMVCEQGAVREDG